MLLNIPHCAGQPPSANYPAPDVNSAEAGNRVLVSYEDAQIFSHKSLGRSCISTAVKCSAVLCPRTQNPGWL